MIFRKKHSTLKKRLFSFCLISFSVLIYLPIKVYSQKTDSIAVAVDTLAKISKKHSPALATILSAACPGVGQIYNRKYWKLPIVWGGIGAFGYLFLKQNANYLSYKRALAIRLDSDSSTVDQYVNKYPNAGTLKQVKENAQYNRDLMAILTGVFYILNIVDANVDGHLFDFDVSEKLSLNLQPYASPSINQSNAVVGIALNLKFK
jgi:hypothetical protein